MIAFLLAHMNNNSSGLGTQGSEMAQWAKGLATILDGLSWWKEKTNSQKLPSDLLLSTTVGAYPPTHTNK